MSKTVELVPYRVKAVEDEPDRVVWDARKSRYAKAGDIVEFPKTVKGAKGEVVTVKPNNDHYELVEAPKKGQPA